MRSADWRSDKNAEAQQILQDAQAECEEFFLSMEADEDEPLLP